MPGLSIFWFYIWFVSHIVTRDLYMNTLGFAFTRAAHEGAIPVEFFAMWDMWKWGFGLGAFLAFFMKGMRPW